MFNKINRVKVLFLVLSSFFLRVEAFAQNENTEEAPEKYQQYSECLQDVFNEADAVKEEQGDGSEIDFLKSKRNSCERVSPISRRIAVKYLEWGDTSYDADGKKDKKDKKKVFEEGLSWARVALQEDSLDHLNYEVASMSFAAIVSASGLKGKVNLADSVRIYAEECIRINSQNDRAHHILGRWHYEVSKLGWFTRMLSKVIFRGTPKGSFDLAINYFTKAIELEDVAVHRYWLGMVYLENGQKEKALDEFRTLQELPLVHHNDQYFKDEAQKMLSKHG